MGLKKDSPCYNMLTVRVCEAMHEQVWSSLPNGANLSGHLRDIIRRGLESIEKEAGYDAAGV